MKIGVVSDTHIPVAAKVIPNQVLETFLREGVFLILHAGDVVEEEGLYDLMGIAPVRAVAGNMDRASIRDRYPDRDLFEVEGVRILLIHGWGEPFGLPDRLYEAYGDLADVIVFGHSHIPYNRRHGDVLLFNPGSPTDRIYAEKRSFGILEIEKGSVSGSIIFLD